MTIVADGGYRDCILANVGDKDPMACLENSRERIHVTRRDGGAEAFRGHELAELIPAGADDGQP